MNKLIVLIFFLGNCFFVRAQDSLRVSTATQEPHDVHLNLNQCLEYAYKHQKIMANSSLDVEIAKAKVKETTGIGLPQINASGNYTYFPKIPITLFPDFISPLVYGVLNNQGVKNSSGQVIQVPTGPTVYTPVAFGLKNTAYASLDLNQILFDGTYLVGLQAARVYKELSTKSLTQSKITTAVNVSKAYYNVLVVKEQIQILESDISRLSKNLSDTRALFSNGLVEKIDLQRIEVQLNTIITQKLKATRLLELSLYSLKYQMGMPLENTLVLDEDVKNLSLPEVVDTTSNDPKQRIEYSLQSTQVHLYQLDLKRNRFTMLPTLNGVAEYRLAYQNGQFSHLFDTKYPQSYLGLNISIPIFSGFERSSRIQQARLTLKKSENDLNDLGRALELDLRNSRVAYLNNLEDLKTQEKNRELSKEIYRVTKIKYEQGIGSSLEVTTAETDLKSAETNYLNALFNALISKVDLDKSMGILAVN